MTARFQSTILLGGRTATGFQVPGHIIDSLNAGKKPRVIVGIGPHEYRSTVAVYGGEYLVPLNAENRRAAGVSAGETVRVSLTLDTAERTIDLPNSLATALDASPGTRLAFEGLSYTKRREAIRSVDSAKRPETQKRRIAKIVDALADGVSS